MPGRDHRLGGDGGAPAEETGELREGGAAGRSESAIRRVRARDVLGQRGILLIEHEGEVYTLRLTRNNRLILTK
jgi:hemin uptake protein HemP